MSIDEIVEKFRNSYKFDARVNLFEIECSETDTGITLSGIVQNDELKNAFFEYCKKSFCGHLINYEVQTIDKSEKVSKAAVRVSTGNVYKEPSFRSTVITQCLMGEIVTVVKRCKDWVMVQLRDNYIGWMTETVTDLSSEQCMQYEKCEKVIVTALCDSVYDSEMMCCIVSDTVIGNVFALSKENKTGYYITYPDNRTGFISRKSSELLSDWRKSGVAAAQTVVETALRFRGIPYVWGGVSSKGLDCSGFTKLVYHMCGIELPRDADMQVKCGYDVPFDRSFSGVKSGDLLFFGRKSETDPTDEIPIVHVALSLGGKLYMQASGDVHISSFDPEDPCFDKRRSESIQKVRRIL